MENNYCYRSLYLMLFFVLFQGCDDHVCEILPRPVETIYSEEIFKVVAQMPRFPGCEDLELEDDKKQCSGELLSRHVYNELCIPPQLEENGSGVVSFIVDEEGLITNIKVLSDAGPGTTDEMIRVVNTFPVWEPGRQRERAVKVQFNLPIKFEL